MQTKAGRAIFAGVLIIAGAAAGWFGARASAVEAPVGPSPMRMSVHSLAGFLLLAFVGLVAVALAEKTKPRLWLAAGALAAFVAGLGGGAVAGWWSVADRHEVTMRGADAILDALERCAAKEKQIPQSLGELVPKYMAAIPPTGYRGTFRFVHRPGQYWLFFFDDLGVRHAFDSKTKRWHAE